MAPRGRRRKPGLMREDAARDAMRNFGFGERLINETIKELLELYGGVDAWRLIEDGGYDVLLNRCLEKQAEQEKQVVEKQEEQVAEEEEEEEEQEQHDVVVKEEEQQVETDALSTTTEAIMDTSPQSVIDTSPIALQSGEAIADYHPIEGAGWLSEEDTDPEEDGHGDNAATAEDNEDDDDDEMIQLTPEPLCEELEELIKHVRGQNKRKRV